MGMTYAQKVLAKACGKDSVMVGDVIEPDVSLAMSHENGSMALNQFTEIYKDTGLEANIWDPKKIAIIFDHRVPAVDAKTATNQKKLRDFVGQQGIEKFHDVRGDEGGICHQILPENGYVLPGGVVVGTDSHTTSHGALGAFAFGVGGSDMAAVWALGKILNVEVPATIKVEVNGKFKPHVGPKDLILHLIGRISAEGANFKVLEFHGETIRTMSTSGRLVICNMSVEAGATAGIVPPDEETVRYLREEANVTKELDIFGPDEDAEYIEVIEIDVASLESQIACPHTVDNVKDISEVVGTKIDQIVVGSCTNGRLDDIEIAAKTLKGKKVKRLTRMLVFPATWKIYREAMKLGYITDLADAGAVVCNPGCGPCVGVHQGALGDKEVALATTNRNFKGRMGNPKAEIYLCSPIVAAASAITGVITDPSEGGN